MRLRAATKGSVERVLVTGFEAFAGEKVNPSELVARALDGQVVAGALIVGVTLPCAFGPGLDRLRKSMRDTKPHAVICLGLAGGAASIRVERIAVNLCDARIPDNRGRQPVDVPVVRGGPAAYWSRLPGRAIVARLKQHRIAASLSDSAGTYVCNHVFYGGLHALRRRPGIPAGFIHLPWLDSQPRRGEFSLPLEKMMQAVALAIECTIHQLKVES